MKKLKILILAGPIYPHNTPRSHRSTELAAGLAKQGHDITLYSLLGAYDYTNFELETNVKVKNYGKSYFGNVNSDSKFYSNSKLFSFINKGLRKIFYNIIDYPRCEYFFKAISALKREKDIDYLITIAHPYGLHWGAAFYKKYYNSNKFKVWSSDCGDPFMGSTNSKRKKIFLKPIEEFWGKQTDFITIPVESSRVGYYEEIRDKIRIIPQSIDFEKVQLNKYKSNKIPTFLYSGAVFPDKRDPRKMLEYLSKLSFDFKFIVYAPDDNIFRDFKETLKDRLEIRRYIPRLELIKELSSMDFLVNLKNKTEQQQPSKLIDYGLSKRPIIDISRHFTDEERLNLEQFLKGDYRNQKTLPNIEQYDSKNVSRKFIDIYYEHNKLV